ncbi:MAG: SGNH/GDSL hydrolase family protein [Candidatus Saccharimonadales bacterium]
MKTVLIFGASVTHGVGGPDGGWADKLKQWLHQKMYGQDGAGEQCTVYELGVPGNTVRDIVSRFEIETLARLPSKDPEETLIILAAGANDTKAQGKPGNFMFTPDEFATNVQAFIRLAKTHAAHVLCVGTLPVDQAKTQPKRNPPTGGSSYFFNQRLRDFEQELAGVCKKEKVHCLPLFEKTPHDWTKNFVSSDGLHPNDAGHEWIFKQVKRTVQRITK